MWDNNSFLCGDKQAATAFAGQSPHGHTFGGPHDRAGASRDDCGGILLHLMHRLNLDDPAIPISIPGLRWLPLYYCFDFRVNEMGYRLDSEESMTPFFVEDDPHVFEEESWPDEDYPLEFPRCEIETAALVYDPSDLDQALWWAGLFGLDGLSPEDLEKAKEQAELDMDPPPENQEELLEYFTWPFMQEHPRSPCINPECSNSSKRGRLQVIALVPGEPIKGVHAFGDHGDFVEMIFELCPICRTVRVSNQCT